MQRPLPAPTGTVHTHILCMQTHIEKHTYLYMNTSKSKSAYYADKVNNYATRASESLKISDGLSTNLSIFPPKTTEYTKIYK